MRGSWRPSPSWASSENSSTLPGAVGGLPVRRHVGRMSERHTPGSAGKVPNRDRFFGEKEGEKMGGSVSVNSGEQRCFFLLHDSNKVVFNGIHTSRGSFRIGRWRVSCHNVHIPKTDLLSPCRSTAVLDQCHDVHSDRKPTVIKRCPRSRFLIRPVLSCRLDDSFDHSLRPDFGAEPIFGRVRRRK